MRSTRKIQFIRAKEALRIYRKKYKESIYNGKFNLFEYFVLMLLFEKVSKEKIMVYYTSLYTGIPEHRYRKLRDEFIFCIEDKHIKEILKFVNITEEEVKEIIKKDIDYFLTKKERSELYE